MKFGSVKFLPTYALVAAMAAMFVPGAQADEYSDVTQLVRAGKLADALSKADQYLAAKPRDPQMRFIKGVILRDAGRQTEAIAAFTKLTEDYPELPEPYNNLAVLYASLTQYDKARAALEMAIRTNPSYATAHENLGDVYAKLASQAYTKALQLDGNNNAVQPKLSLIRELFNPTGKGQRPVAAAQGATAAPALATPTAAPTAASAPAAKVPAAPAPAVAPAPAPVAPSAATDKTPTAAATPSKAPAQASDGNVEDVQNAVQTWAKAWANKDMTGYLGAYGKAFVPPSQQSRGVWEEERRKRIVGKASIKVKLEDLNVQVNGSTAVAKFRQIYKADSLDVTSRKTLNLVKAGDRWVIVRESAGG